MNLVVKMPAEKTEFGSKPFEEWAAYKNMTLDPDPHTTLDWQLSDGVVTELTK